MLRFSNRRGEIEVYVCARVSEREEFAKDQTKENVVAAVIVAVADNGKLGNQKCFRSEILQSNYK